MELMTKPKLISICVDQPILFLFCNANYFDQTLTLPGEAHSWD